MLTRQQRQAVKLMAYTDKTQHEISEILGISRMSLFNWRKLPAFKQALQEELDFQLEEVRNGFKRDAKRVRDKLMEIVEDPNSSNKDVISAGKFLLEQPLGKAVSNVDLVSEQRINIKEEIPEEDILDVFDEEIVDDEDDE